MTGKPAPAFDPTTRAWYWRRQAARALARTRHNPCPAHKEPRTTCASCGYQQCEKCPPHDCPVGPYGAHTKRGPKPGLHTPAPPDALVAIQKLCPTLTHWTPLAPPLDGWYLYFPPDPNQPLHAFVDSLIALLKPLGWTRSAYGAGTKPNGDRYVAIERLP